MNPPVPRLAIADVATEITGLVDGGKPCSAPTVRGRLLTLALPRLAIKQRRRPAALVPDQLYRRMPDSGRAQ